MESERIANHVRSQKRFLILLIAIGFGLGCGVSFAFMWASNYAQSPVFNPGGGPQNQFTIDSCTFFGTAPSYTAINMSIQNTGASSWSLTTPAQVNSLKNVPLISVGNKGNLNCTGGKTISISLTTPCTSGSQYSITLTLSDGNRITYVVTAP
jgi:hypothetical protein